MMQEIPFTYQAFSEMTAEERMLHDEVRRIQERHLAELKPYWDRLTKLAMQRPPFTLHITKNEPQPIP